MKKSQKVVSVVLSFCLATMMVPASALAQPANNTSAEEAVVAQATTEPSAEEAAADEAAEEASASDSTVASTSALTTLEAEEPAADVPENLQLSELRFADSSGFSWATKYNIEGGFNPAKSEVTVIINDCNSSFAAHAKLGSAASGEITAEYTDAEGNQRTVTIDPDADENNATPFNGGFVQSASNATMSYAPKSFIIKVGGKAAYKVTIKRRATIYNVTLDGATLADNASFTNNTYEYNVNTVNNSFTITPTFNSLYDESKLTFTGTGTVTPTWDSNNKADVSITVADKEGKGEASTYTFHVQHYDIARAQAVIDKINAIGEVDLSKETQITEARAAYNELPTILQAEVTNIATLDNAELALSNLKYPTDRLENVVFGSGYSESDPRAFYTEPVSSTSMRDYNVYMSNNATGIYTVIATAKADYTDSITVTYTNTYTNNSVTDTLTSGTRYWPTGMISSTQYSSATVLINANGQLYRYTIYKVPSISSLSLTSGTTTTELFSSDSELGKTPGQSFSVEAAPNQTLSASCTYYDWWDGDITGTATVSEPTWANHKAQVTISAWADKTEGVKPYLAFATLNETPSKIEITKAPTKTTYKMAESFDPTGMEVKATYANGDVVTVNNDDLTCELTSLNNVHITYNGAETDQAITTTIPFPGSGTEKDPYVLSTSDHMADFAYAVNHGMSFEGMYVELGADVTLPTSWTQVGCLIDSSLKSIKAGDNLYPFSGTFDGKGYTLTVPKNEKALFSYVKGATIKNLKLYGEKIKGCGLISNMAGVGLSGTAVIIDNVTILSGTTTTSSGFFSGTFSESPYAGVSAYYESTIKNCTIEEGVTIGSYSYSYVGSFAGRFQGTIENCESYASVSGAAYVGGIIGCRDNAMGNVTVKNCKFHGTVETYNNDAMVYAGGIVGCVYDDSVSGEDTAPNAIRINIIDNYCDGTIKGNTYVGGILGGDGMVAQAWNEYEFSGNMFCGNIARGNADTTGAIIGYYRSLNKYDNISNNTYLPNCSTAVSNIKAIGKVDYVDTNNAAIVSQFAEGEYSATINGTLYFNTEKNTKGCPDVKGCSWKIAHNRTDDPLGAGSSALFAPAFEVSAAIDSTATSATSPVKVGDTVTVQIVAKSSNYNIAALSGTFDYDSNVFKLTSVTKGAGLSDGASFMPADNKAEAVFSFYKNDSATTAENGVVIATATFEALKAADSSTITVKDIMIGCSGDTLEYSVTADSTAAVNVIAKDATQGDVNNNGHINIVDAQLAYDLSTNIFGTDYASFPLPEDWTKATLVWVANVNNDDAIDAADALAIQYHAHYGAFSKEA